MSVLRLRQLGVFVVVALAGVTSCSGDKTTVADPTATSAGGDNTAAQCASAVDSIVSATQRYVNGYEAGRSVSPTAATTTSGAPADTANDTITEDEFQGALDEAEAALAAHPCERQQVLDDLTAGLGQIRPEGPVADAVLRQLTASMTGGVARAPASTAVPPSADLRDVLAASPDGSTLQLDAGEYRMDASLAMLSGVTIRGAGRDATTIVSTAPDAAIIVLTDQRVELADLTIRREGDAPGSAVLSGPVASVVVNGARISGGKADADGAGGAGILMFAAEPSAAGRGTTLEVTDAEFSLNETAGIVLTGGHRSSIVRATFGNNGQCGICFIGAADGSVEDSTFQGNRVGIAVTGSAMPALLRLTINGGEVGIQVGDAAAPAIDTVAVSGAASAAAIYSGAAAGGFERFTCENVEFGIVVGPDAQPHVGETNCEFTPGQ